MLTVGKVYQVKTVEDGTTTTHHNCKVVKVDMPVVKFDHCGKEWIVNLSSSAVVSAEPQ